MEKKTLIDPHVAAMGVQRCLCMLETSVGKITCKTAVHVSKVTQMQSSLCVWRSALDRFPSSRPNSVTHHRENKFVATHD